MSSKTTIKCYMVELVATKTGRVAEVVGHVFDSRRGAQAYCGAYNRVLKGVGSNKARIIPASARPMAKRVAA